jgi:hypothetical protein
MDIWFRKNGTDIPESNTVVTVSGGANQAKVVAAWNYMLKLNAGDYVELMWRTSDVRLEFISDPAGTNPTRPAIPSVIATAHQVLYTQLGPTGATGPIGPIGATSSIFGISIDGASTVITPGVKGYVTIPYNGTITGWDIFADTTGSCVIDLWKDTYANFPPTVADTITGTEKPTLSNQQKNQDNSLTTWNTSVSQGDVIAFNVDSATLVTRVNLHVKVNRS